MCKRTPHFFEHKTFSVEDLLTGWGGIFLETRTTMEESRKNDRLDGKLRWELLPLQTLEEIVKIYTFGAEKYGPNTWQGLENGYERYKAALLRHLVSYEKGETHDAESGIHALAHMAWNAIAMLYLAIEKEKIQ